MTRDLELDLWRSIRTWRPGDHAPTPREWGNQALEDGRINNYRQMVRALEKWSRKGLYDYGVSLDLGWKTSDADTPEEALAAMRSALPAPKLPPGKSS